MREATIKAITLARRPTNPKGHFCTSWATFASSHLKAADSRSVGKFWASSRVFWGLRPNRLREPPQHPTQRIQNNVHRCSQRVSSRWSLLNNPVVGCENSLSISVPGWLFSVWCQRLEAHLSSFNSEAMSSYHGLFEKSRC